MLIGGSYIGCEVAASLVAADHASCEIVMQEAVTLSRGFGDAGRPLVPERLEEHGIDVHGEDELERFEGADGRVTHVVTKSGLRLEADGVVIGAGVMPDMMLARAAGLELDEERGGVLCDSQPAHERARRVGGRRRRLLRQRRPTAARIRVEHWDVAFNHGKTVALNMLGQEVEHDVVPYFFSDLADWASLEYVGPAASWDREIVRGSLDEGEFSVWYLDGGRVEGALSVGRSDDLEHARRLIASGQDRSGRSVTEGGEPGTVLEVLQPAAAGVPNYVLALSAGLRERGRRVTVAAPPEVSIAHQLSELGIARLDFSASRMPARGDLRILRALARWCREHRPDVIHSHSSKASVLGGSLARVARVPSVYTPHTWAFQMRRALPSRVIFAGAEAVLSATCHDRIAVVSDAEREAALHWRLPKARGIRVVHTGLASPPDPPPSETARRALDLPVGPTVVAWVGRLDPAKQPQLLPPLAEALARHGVVLAVLGHGLADHPIGQELTRRGGVLLPEGTDPVVVYGAADIVVQTSAWEGSPLGVLEAMHARLPVVAFGVGGVPEQVIDGTNGRVVAPDDVEALLAALLDLDARPDERRRMGLEGARRRGGGVRLRRDGRFRRRSVPGGRPGHRSGRALPFLKRSSRLRGSSSHGGCWAWKFRTDAVPANRGMFPRLTPRRERRFPATSLHQTSGPQRADLPSGSAEKTG